MGAERLEKLTSEELRNVYNDIPKSYDRTNSIISFGMDVRWRTSLVKSAMKYCNSPLTVLDVASGKGETTYVLQKLYRRAFYVLTDYAENMLLNALVEDDRVLASFDHLPFRDDSFDMVVSTFALHAADDYEAVIREMTRVSKKVVAALAMGKPMNPLLRAYVSFYLRFVMPYLAPLGGGKPEQYRAIYLIYAKKDKLSDWYVKVAEKYLDLKVVEYKALQLFYAFVGLKRPDGVKPQDAQQWESRETQGRKG